MTNNSLTLVHIVFRTQNSQIELRQTLFTMSALTFFAKSIIHACYFIGSNKIFAHEIDQSQFIYVVHHACTHIFRKVHKTCVRFHWFVHDFRTCNRPITVHLRCSPCLHSHFSQIRKSCVRFHWFEHDFRTSNRPITVHLRCSPCLHSNFSQIRQVMRAFSLVRT